MLYLRRSSFEYTFAARPGFASLWIAVQLLVSAMLATLAGLTFLRGTF